nr:hypothetical protein [Tanacetum cinerariifolium]
MATTIEQQVALDEALVPNIKRLTIGRRNFRLPSNIQSKEPTLQVVYDVLRGCPFFKAFLVTVDVPEIYMHEFWVTAYVHQHSIRFKMDSKKNIVDLEAFREMLHISPRVLGQSFDELPFEEELLDFVWFLGHSAQIKTLSDKHRLCLSDLGRFCVSSGTQESKEEQRDVLPQIHKSHHPSLHDEETFNSKMKQDIRNTKAYNEYYACATGEAAPKPKASTRRKRGGSDSSTTPPTAVASPRPIKTIAATPRLTAAAKGKQPAKAKSPYDPLEVERTEAEQLKIVLRRSRKEMHISQHSGSSTDEGIDVDVQGKGRDDDEGKKNDESDDGKDDDDNNDDEEETAKIDKPEDTESGEDDEETQSDGESEKEETREEEEESFDPIPRTLKDSKDDGNSEEDQGLRGRGQQGSQDIEDSHVTLTLVKPDGVESIFTTASSLIEPLKTPTPIMTPSTIAIITISSDAPIPSTTIPSEVLQNLPTFDLVFRFEDRVKSLEVNFLEFMQTNQFAKAVSNIPVAADLTEMELKKILIEKMEGNKSIQRSEEQRNLYKALVDAYETDKTILESYGQIAVLKRRCEDDDDQEGPSAGSDRGFKRRREGWEPESASTPSEPATRSTGRSTTGTQSRQMSASKSAFAEEHVQTTCQMDGPSHPVFETAAQGRTQLWISDLAKQADSRSSFNELLDTPIDFSNFIMNRLGVDTLTPELLAGPTYELMRGSCNSLTELEYHLEEVYKATTDQLDWINPKGKQYPHNLQQPLPLIPDNRGRRVIPFAHFINNDLKYLRGGTSSRKYTTSVTKTKAADYGHIKWIENLVPRTMWIQEPINYDKHALWGVSHWGRKRQ